MESTAQISEVEQLARFIRHVLMGTGLGWALYVIGSLAYIGGEMAWKKADNAIWHYNRQIRFEECERFRPPQAFTWPDASTINGARTQWFPATHFHVAFGNEDPCEGVTTARSAADDPLVLSR